MLFTRSKDISNRFSNNPGPVLSLRIAPASLQQIIKDSRVPIPPPAARGAATPGLRQNPEGKTGKSFVAFKRCLSAMPQVQPALSEIMGFRVRAIEGLHELEPLRWSSETLLLSVRSLDRLQDIISTGNVGLMRGIHTLGVFMPTQLGRVREFVTLLDGWLVWNGSADDLRAKLDLAASGYAMVAPAMISVMAADQHRLTLLDTLTEAHLSLLPLLADGMTDEEIANARGATLPTTKLLVRQLLARLQCRNRTEAAIFAWRHATALAQRRAVLRSYDEPEAVEGRSA
jgi:DNA-binding CsgD family transcriptional regulator